MGYGKGYNSDSDDDYDIDYAGALVGGGDLMGGYAKGKKLSLKKKKEIYFNRWKKKNNGSRIGALAAWRKLHPEDKSTKKKATKKTATKKKATKKTATKKKATKKTATKKKTVTKNSKLTADLLGCQEEVAELLKGIERIKKHNDKLIDKLAA
jgi:hypothetical protein